MTTCCIKHCASVSDVQDMVTSADTKPSFLTGSFQFQKECQQLLCRRFFFQQPRQQLASARVFKWRFECAFVTCCHKGCKQKQASDTGREVSFALRIKRGGTPAPGGVLQIVKLGLYDDYMMMYGPCMGMIFHKLR